MRALEGDAGKPAPRTHRGLVTAWGLDSGVFRGGVICVRFRGQSGRVTHPTKRRSIPRGMGVPPVRVLEKPVGCVSWGEGVGRWCGRTCPANTPGVGSWYGALVLVCSAAGSFARGGDAIQAASHTLRRGVAFRVARASRPCWWDCATFQVALPRARSIWLSAVDDGAGAIGGGDPSLPVVFDAALDETDAQSSLLNLSDRSQPSSCHRSHEMDM